MKKKKDKEKSNQSKSKIKKKTNSFYFSTFPHTFHIVIDIKATPRRIGRELMLHVFILLSYLPASVTVPIAYSD